MGFSRNLLYLLLSITVICDPSDTYSSRDTAGQSRIHFYASSCDAQPVEVSLPLHRSSAQGFSPMAAPSHKRTRKGITVNIYLRSNPGYGCQLANPVLDSYCNSRRYLPLKGVGAEDSKRVALRCCESYSLAFGKESRVKVGVS